MDCIFCKIAQKKSASKVLYEDDLVMVIMDIKPIVDGHVLIIPKKHYTDYQELDSEITTHIFEVAKKIGKHIMDKLDKKSITLLINYGDDQQVKHYHLHILPDFGVTDVIRCKYSLDEVYDILKKN